MNITEIIVVNIVIYIGFSLSFLLMGCVTGINRTAGYILMSGVLICAIYIIISGIVSSVDSGVSLWKDTEPSGLIGSFVSGLTGIYWYNIGKNIIYMINDKW